MSDQPTPKPEDVPLRLRERRAGMQQVFERLRQETAPQAKVLTNSVGMKFVLIPSGSFQMGAPPAERSDRWNERPAHEVLITQPFYLGVTPVTQEQYLALVDKNPARFHMGGGGGRDHPVENVSWEDATAFCRRLSQLDAERQAGWTYRLPTEAEWEYSCRGGTRTPFYYGNALSSREANIDGRFPHGDTPPGPHLGKTTPVGQYAANNFGLHDMHGNVWEWCADWYGGEYYAYAPTRDPQGPEMGEFRVVRGGSWRSHGSTCRAAYRNALVPNNRDPYTGFRVLCFSTPRT